MKKCVKSLQDVAGSVFHLRAPRLRFHGLVVYFRQCGSISIQNNGIYVAISYSMKLMQ
jgi:hypothetical protein